MWQYQQDLIDSNVTAAQIWAAWSTVSAWPNWWKASLKAARCVGPFADGDQLIMQTKYLITSKALLADIVAGKSFTVLSKLPGATLRMQHEVKPVDAGTKITYRLRLDGALTPIYKIIIGTSIKLQLPKVLTTLVSYAKHH